MIIDGHAHACGNYQDNESINQSIVAYNLSYIVLTAGELNSKKIYSMVDRTQRDPYKDVVNALKYIIKAVVTIAGAAKQIPEGNQYVYDLKKNDNRIKQFYWITNESIDEIKKKYELMGFDGVKIHQCWVKKDLTSQWFKDLASFLIEKDIPIFIHLGSYKQTRQLIAFQREFKSLKIIVGHCYGLEHFIENANIISNNVYFDISNNYFVSRERIEKAVKVFGAKRLLLGSDTPYGEDSLPLTIERVKALEVSVDEQEDILGNNLARLLKIIK